MEGCDEGLENLDGQVLQRYRTSCPNLPTEMTGRGRARCALDSLPASYSVATVPGVRDDCLTECTNNVCYDLSGLGTSTSKEAKEYFSDMNRHRIDFTYGGAKDDQAIDMVIMCGLNCVS